MVTLIADAGDVQSQDPTVEDLASWASDGGLTHPVIADVGWGYGEQVWPGSFNAAPQNIMLKPGMVVHAKDLHEWTGATTTVEEQIPNILP